MTVSPIDKMPTRSLDEALQRIDSLVFPLGSEELAAGRAVHRVLTHDAVAGREFPSCDRAASRGLALRAVETVGASPYNPLGFRLCDRTEVLVPGTAVHVEAGGCLPAGADAVAPLEFVQAGTPGAIEVIEAVPAEHEIERKASHFSRDTALLRAGRVLRATDLGLLGAGGVERVMVVRQPRIAVLSRAGTEGAAGDFAMLHCLVERDGGRIVDVRTIDGALAAACRSIADVDMVLLGGGPERGRDHDAAAAFAQAGDLEIAEIALSPGGSVALGRTAQGVWAFSLPAGVTSSFWAYEAVIGRVIRRLSGRAPGWPFRCCELKLARKIVSTIGLTEFWSIRWREDGLAEPLSGYARSNPRILAEADGFVLVPEGSEGMSAGSSVQVYVFESAARPATPDP